ncbi:MAG: hypothetical protein ACPGQL_01410 [Thermoplasmatota archaeon]
MVAPRTFLTLTLLTAALAGCISEDAPTDDAGDQPIGEATGQSMVGPLNETFPWSMTVAVAGPFFYAYPPYVTEGPFGGQVKIGDNATSISATSDWSCMSGPACELALVFFHNDDFIAAVEGTEALSLEVTDPKPGTWTVTMFASANGAAVVQAAGDIDVTVAYGDGMEASEEPQSDETA